MVLILYPNPFCRYLAASGALIDSPSLCLCAGIRFTTFHTSNSTRRAHGCHDLTCRLNLGLAIGLAEGAGEDHLWYAFEARRHRALKSLGDLNGTEIYIHDGKINGLFRCLMNALARSEHRPTVPDLRAIYRDVGRAAQASRKQLETRHLYESRPFLDLVVVASSSARLHIPSLRESGG